VEQRILTELKNSSGVDNVQLLDQDGLVSMSISSNQNIDFSSIIGVLEQTPESQSVTITSQNAIIIANRLDKNNVLIIPLQPSCNLGLIRKLLAKAVEDLNALQV
jgi:predicted regulator of Ras-like GTPase activity (Roadblock/LC7/MglB family)